MADQNRSATASWHGTLREGNGVIGTQSGTLHDTSYTFVSRFEDGKGTNPEELIAAAHAGCYSMALANGLSKKEYAVHHITTTATVHLTQSASGSAITKITLKVRGKVDEISADSFLTAAEETKNTCIVSKALSAVPMELDAALE
jgi:osmotically inducible protein OsmC